MTNQQNTTGQGKGSGSARPEQQQGDQEQTPRAKDNRTGGAAAGTKTGSGDQTGTGPQQGSKDTNRGGQM